jgi:membrane fusion protein (multidrug efflux system)
MSDQSAATDGSTTAGNGAAARRRARWRWPLMLGGLAATLILGLWYYLASGRYVSTDDSSVEAAQVAISTNVPGRVVQIDVHDNQAVHRGDVLFRLDDRPFRIAVEEAQAKLAAARLQIGAAKASYRHQLAEISAARGTADYQESELARQQRLLSSGIASRAQFEQTQHALVLARSQLSSAQQTAASVLAMLGGNPNLPVDSHPLVLEAQAALDRANLELSYAVIRAPDDGVVAKVEQLQAGDYVNAATPVFSLISSGDIWVEANFKEDELAHVRVGQSAEVSIDAYGGRRFRAHVASLSPGTGSQFSVLPPENATGNWVKVVQRIPVRLQLEPSSLGTELPLQAGMSAEATIDTEHRRSLLGWHRQAPAQVAQGR